MRIRNIGLIETNGFQSQYIRFSYLTDHYILFICEIGGIKIRMQVPAMACSRLSIIAGANNPVLK